ncbi:MAG: hypothetical protein AB7G80_09645 [Dongiaceae bacterium]
MASAVDVREIMNEEDDKMDLHNNELGRKIGLIAQKNGWSREQTTAAVREVMKNGIDISKIDPKTGQIISKVDENSPAWLNRTWEGYPKYDETPNVPGGLSKDMAASDWNWPNVDFNNPYHNNPYGPPPGFKPYVTGPSPKFKLDEQEFGGDQQSQNGSDEPTEEEIQAALDEMVDPVSGKPYEDMSLREELEARFVEPNLPKEVPESDIILPKNSSLRDILEAAYRQQEIKLNRRKKAEFIAKTRINSGMVHVKAHTREGGKEHVDAYDRNPPGSKN